MSIQQAYGKDIFLTGWGHTPFGKRESDTLESLVVAAGAEAIARSGVDPGDIDEIFLGTFNSGMEPLGFASSLALQIDSRLAMRGATRVENACASGSAALQQATKSLLAGTARRVLVVGAEKMTAATPDVVGAALLGADYDSAGKPSSTGFTGLFAGVAREYEHRYQPVGDVLGSIASKSHMNGLKNPYAHLRKELSVDFCRTISDKNPIVVEPLRRTDCSPVSDGAAAVVLTTERVAAAATDPVRLLGFAHANDFMPAARRDPVAFAGSVAAWERALALAGVSRSDLDFAEVHDCFTIAELIMYEVMGLAPRGQGYRVVEDGTVYPTGSFPVNPSGGLKSKGHPVGATGVSQHVVSAMQLTGTAGDMQLPRARRAAVHNMGGLAIANYVSVLESV